MENADPHLLQIARGAELSLANALQLQAEAIILAANCGFSRALLLHQISLEECAKIDILGAWASSHLMGLPVNTRKLESALVSHKAKNFTNAYMLPATEAERKARQESNWEASLNAFKDQQVAFHEQANTRKNAALYVDYFDGTFHAPTDRITEDMVHDIALRNAQFIELVRPKVCMLVRWVEEPEHIRGQLQYVRCRMEELRLEMPENPQRAFDLVHAEMLERAQHERASQAPNDA
jgi:AbiV family abortive infection protein